MLDILNNFNRLIKYCELQEFKGWDPYDGLNSKIFKTLPVIKNIDFARLAWIQLFKRNPVNLRRLFLVPKGYNSKGIALILTGYSNLLEYQKQSGERIFGDLEGLLGRIRSLADLLVSLRSPSVNNNSAWGYNFDWQSKVFFLPAETPTIVATSFAMSALVHAYMQTNEERYLKTALLSVGFIKNELNRIPKKNGFMFSYSPLDKQAVYNATLLATRSLSQAYTYTIDEECKELAFLSARAVCDLQNEDGSFPHSDQVGNSWRDNFHTGFKLESLAIYQKNCSDNTFLSNIERGFEYWFKNFFDHTTGIAYYYDNDRELIDLHCLAQAIPTFYHLNKFSLYKDFISSAIAWAITNMQDDSGYFYYQKKGNRINKIPYMRWPNAWMFYGMSYYLLATLDNEKDS